MANGESCAQVMIALGELGISLEDARFVKNGRTLLDGLLTFYRPGQGFVHAAAGGGAAGLGGTHGESNGFKQQDEPPKGCCRQAAFYAGCPG